VKVLFVCASIDVNNAVVGDTLDRAEALSKHKLVTSLVIVALRGTGQKTVGGLKVFGVGSDSRSRVGTLVSFITTITKAVVAEKPDIFYLYMCPILSPLLWLHRCLFGIKVVQWFGHAVYTLPTRVALRWFSDLWFNSNESMATFKAKHIRFVGQGVKAEQFFYDSTAEKKFDIVTVGRITPVKKIEKMVEVLKTCRDKLGFLYTLNICGDSFVERDKEYQDRVKALVKEYDLQKQVIFSGMISRREVPNVLRSSRVFLFLIPGGVGKASLESLACGLPVVASSLDAVDFFGEELSRWYLCEKDSLSIANALVRILEAPPEVYVDLCEKSYALFQNKYTMEKFIDRIVQTIQIELISQAAKSSE
jgi:glycosyltransferase involved in cell wall biosynthesis